MLCCRAFMLLRACLACHHMPLSILRASKACGGQSTLAATHVMHVVA